MSFTGTDIVNPALLYADVDSANISADNQKILLNEVLRDYQVKIGSQDVVIDLTTVSTPPLVAGTQEYAFTAYEIDDIRAVMYRQSSTSQWVPLLPIKKEGAAAYDQQSGLPLFWYVYDPAGVQTFGFSPKPSAAFAVAGATIRIFARAKFSELTAIGDTIYLPLSAKTPLANLLGSRFADVDGNNTKAEYLRQKYREAMVLVSEDKVKTEILPKNNTCPTVMGPAGFDTNDRRWWGL